MYDFDTFIDKILQINNDTSDISLKCVCLYDKDFMDTLSYYNNSKYKDFVNRLNEYEMSIAEQVYCRLLNIYPFSEKILNEVLAYFSKNNPSFFKNNIYEERYIPYKFTEYSDNMYIQSLKDNMSQEKKKIEDKQRDQLKEIEKLKKELNDIKELNNPDLDKKKTIHSDLANQIRILETEFSDSKVNEFNIVNSKKSREIDQHNTFNVEKLKELILSRTDFTNSYKKKKAIDDLFKRTQEGK